MEKQAKIKYLTHKITITLSQEEWEIIQKLKIARQMPLTRIFAPVVVDSAKRQIEKLEKEGKL